MGGTLKLAYKLLVNDRAKFVTLLVRILLSATSGIESLSFSDWFTWPSRFWSIGPSAVETIFEGGLRKATVQQYQAMYQESVANYRQTSLTAFQQVEDNLAALRILSQDLQRRTPQYSRPHGM
jgi:outer membrane protein TolC